MAIDPNIALGFRPIEVANPLAQYGQVAQIQAAQNQNQVSQMQLDQMRRDDDTMKQIQAKSVEHGGPADINVIANAYMNSGNPKFVEFGVNLRQRLDDRAQFAKIMGMGGGAPAAPALEVSSNRVNELNAAPGVEVFKVNERPAPVNNLAPTAAPTAAPSVNALAAPPAGPDVAMLRQKRDMFLSMGTAQGNAAARTMDAEIALASRQQPETIREMQAFGIPITPEGFKTYQDAKRQDRLLTPEELKQKLLLVAAGRAPGTNITMVSERAEQGARGKMLVDQYGDISKAAGLAARTLPAIESNLSALNKGFDTGFGKETVAAGASVLAALGVKDAEKFATDTQKFQSNAIGAVLQKQLEQKGPQTESDAKRIEQIGAQLGKTKNANEFILATAREQLKRDVDQRNFYDRWYKTNKTYDGAEDSWFNGEGGKSLFDRPALKKYNVSAADVNVAPTASNRPSLESIFKK
jgi:hypothetical protein